jgi:hypothetical protein
MAAKEVSFNDDARLRMFRGVNILADQFAGPPASAASNPAAHVMTINANIPVAAWDRLP